MSARRLSLPFAALLLAVTACGEGAPSLAPTTPARETRLLRLPSTADQRSFEVVGTSVVASGLLERPAFTGGDDASALFVGPSVDKYWVSFWAVQGKSRSVQINYLVNGKKSPYLKFTASDPEWAPGIGKLDEGDSVQVTMIVDPAVVGAVFAPAGLEFGTPSQFQIWYGGVGGDLNGDGKVDSEDAYIEQKLLGMSYREDIFKPWQPIPYTKNTTENWIRSNVYHFSEYAVSW